MGQPNHHFDVEDLEEIEMCLLITLWQGRKSGEHLLLRQFKDGHVAAERPNVLDGCF